MSRRETTLFIMNSVACSSRHYSRSNPFLTRSLPSLPKIEKNANSGHFNFRYIFYKLSIIIFHNAKALIHVTNSTVEWIYEMLEL